MFKVLILAGYLACAALAMPQGEPRQSQPRASCSAMPNWMYSSSDRIVNGQEAPSMIPWQVWLLVPPYRCGGTILDSKTILSAAHCTKHLSNDNLDGVKIRAGTVDKWGLEIGQTINVAKLVYDQSRPYGSGGGSNNDIVILKLESPLTFNKDVQPACLPSPSWNPPTGTMCYVSGWGALESGGSSPRMLQWVGVPIYSQDICNSNYNNGITNAMICAGYKDGGKDSCQGDSGGPFVCSNNGQAVITGVVSFGNGCAWADAPGVYARVTVFLDWIKAEMEGGGGSSPSPSGCGNPDYANDQYCDDANNNPECNYDGGACCGPNVVTKFCKECQCKEKSCAKPDVANDDYCDDENNVPECNYDGGACCRPHLLTNYCTECKCKQF